MKSPAARRRAGAHAEAERWRQKHDAVLTIVNAILLAYGDGEQHRMAIASSVFTGKPRRNVAVESLGDRIVVYLEPSPPSQPEEEPRDN